MKTRGCVVNDGKDGKSVGKRVFFKVYTAKVCVCVVRLFADAMTQAADGTPQK